MPKQTAVWVLGPWAGSWAEGRRVILGSSVGGSNSPSGWHEAGSEPDLRESRSFVLPCFSGTQQIPLI